MIDCLLNYQIYKLRTIRMNCVLFGVTIFIDVIKVVNPLHCRKDRNMCEILFFLMLLFLNFVLSLTSLTLKALVRNPR